MSQRELKLDPDEMRKAAYRDMDPDEVQEALWEALDKLQAGGIDIGSKASGVLVKRKNIKASIPK